MINETVNCPFCGSNQTKLEVNAEQVRNLESESYIGSVENVYGCANCGKVFKIEAPVIEHDKPEDNPSGQKQEEQETLPVKQPSI